MCIQTRLPERSPPPEITDAQNPLTTRERRRRRRRRRRNNLLRLYNYGYLPSLNPGVPTGTRVSRRELEAGRPAPQAGRQADEDFVSYGDPGPGRIQSVRCTPSTSWVYSQRVGVTPIALPYDFLS